MKTTNIRKRFRQLLEDNQTHVLPVVFDAISARIAEQTGFEVALVSGNVASASFLAMPDIGLMTMTEMVELVRRICRVTSVGYLVDADNGYGNAINLSRCVHEFEAAGSAAIMFEDTDLPARYGQKSTVFLTRKEMCDKLKAAVDARSDTTMVLVGRTDSLRPLGIEEALDRVRAYSSTGVDAIFVPGVQTREEYAAIRSATSLPLIGVGLPKLDSDKKAIDSLRDCGVGMTVTSKIPFQVSVQAMHDALTHLRKTNEFGQFESQMCSQSLLDELLNTNIYAQHNKQYLDHN